jgi:Glutamyl-tRNAGlu reductase, dimerisation domain
VPPLLPHEPHHGRLSALCVAAAFTLHTPNINPPPPLPPAAVASSQVVEKLSKGIVNKMLHGPMSALRSPEGPEQKKRTLQILKQMFRLEKELDA